jgi:hypothetical protein
MKTQSFIEKLWQDKNGHQALIQKPNIPLISWFVFSVIGMILPDGRMADISQVISFGFLFTWAWLEVYSGNTYLRRVLGAIILVFIIYSRTK